VAIIGAGGIGFDVAEYLLHDPNSKPPSVDIEKFLKEWGIDGANQTRGGLRPEGETHEGAFR
jgi:2,4-dienoyl-CoA reductase (NADPH2)